MKSKSDGSTASYYELPAESKELQDLISHRDMNAQIGEIFRACYRYGIVEHSEMLRDAKKIKFYAEAEIKRLKKLAESISQPDWDKSETRADVIGQNGNDGEHYEQDLPPGFVPYYRFTVISPADQVVELLHQNGLSEYCKAVEITGFIVPPKAFRVLIDFKQYETTEFPFVRVSREGAVFRFANQPVTESARARGYWRHDPKLHVVGSIPREVMRWVPDWTRAHIDNAL